MRPGARARDNGLLLRALGLVHALVGAVLFRRELRAMRRAGVIAAVPLRGGEATAFWFLVPSPLIWIVGRLVSQAEASGERKTVRAAHRAGLLSAAFASLCMPVSGFWAWLAISARGLWQWRDRPGRN